MAKGGSRKEQLEAVDKELDEEIEHWKAMQLSPGSVYRMGDMELHIRCEILALMEILKQKLGVEQEDFDLHFKAIVLRELRNMRPQIQEQQAEARRQAIVDGVQLIPPRPPDFPDPRNN